MKTIPDAKQEPAWFEALGLKPSQARLQTSVGLQTDKLEPQIIIMPSK